MSYHVTNQHLQQLKTEPDPGFLLDVVLRVNGTLHMVHEALMWDDALLRVEDALLDGFTVELMEA